MKWKRCGNCKDLKPVDSFWKKDGGYQSKCIDCMKKEYQKNKKKKKLYDKIRYENNKQDKEEYVCMRCEEFVANVKNNVMFWCFHCLFKYEKEWKQKIPVEVINPVIRRSNYFKERVSVFLFSKKSNKIEELIYKFVLKLEDKNILDEKIKTSIIELSTTENVEEIMNDFIAKIEIHKSYDDEAGVQFPWRGYIDKFMED